ncbi:MAG: TonB-dependent receptor [Candidatus Symbiothrix sp.]|jgi:TonB-linked SusC/RagA family outer membrane protein|nr:TonB-dependent receptor [Candidatus Symbiothrix sp.]
MKKNTIFKIYLIICLLFTGLYVANADTTGQQQSITVTGKVVDANELPLIGVSVTVPKTTVGTVTDMDGNYSLTIPSSSAEIQFSYIGFKSQTIKIGGKRVINVTLQEDTEMLGEVVVVGYGTQKKETVVGAIATVSTKDLLQSPQANISNALAGRMPGLLSVQRSGEPGKDASLLRIRGVGTFAQNPDGYQGSDPQDPLVMVDGIESSNFNNIDPSEIETVSILKDASATAVYGVRGANGVILITTRRGTLGKPRISLTTNVAVSDFPFLRKNMNAYDYAMGMNRALANDTYVTKTSYYPEYLPAELEAYRTHSDPIFYPDMDWHDYMIKDRAYQSQTNFNVGGGTEKVKYFVSLGFFTQEGMFETSHYDPGYDYQSRYKRYNLRSNFDINITKDLLASFDLSTQIGDFRSPQWSMGNLLAGLTTTPASASPGIIDNQLISIPRGTSPMIPFTKGWSRNYENNLNGSIRLTYKMDYLLKGLSLRGAVSYKNFNTDKREYKLQGISYSAQRLSDGSIAFLSPGNESPMQFGWEIDKSTLVYMEGGAEYTQHFGSHNVTGLILYNQQKLYAPYLAFLIPEGIQGLVGRATYNYKNRYLAEFNIGYNGSENFVEGRRFGVFPAYSLGWVMTEEPFFTENEYVTFAKIRGAYGVVGNQKIGGDRFLYRPTAYEYEGDAYFLGPQVSAQGWKGSLEGKMGNPLLTWETAVKKNIGIDARFWKNKIDLTFDYFVENRDNILWNRKTIPAIIGANMPAYNLGEMKNSGWDGEISYYDKWGKVNYFVRANYTYAHNVVEYWDEVARTYAYRNTTGMRHDQYFGFIADGIYNTWEEVNDVNRPVYRNNNNIQPGDIIFRDVNGDGYIDEDDQVPIGYSNFPEVMFGVALGANWNNFDVSVLFQGADRVSTMPGRSIKQGFWQKSGATEDLLRSWTQERYEQGLPIAYPRYAADNSVHNYQTSTFWLENARYLRLKNAEIGYTFRQDYLKKIGVGSVRFYVNGSNLITWCTLFKGEDPEFPSGNNDDPYPVTRIFNVGLNINF